MKKLFIPNNLFDTIIEYTFPSNSNKLKLLQETIKEFTVNICKTQYQLLD